jgi:hypothetical protein
MLPMLRSPMLRRRWPSRPGVRCGNELPNWGEVTKETNIRMDARMG